MPHYVFNVMKDGHSPDTVGADLKDLEAARCEAARMMGNELKHGPETFFADEEWRIDVCEDDGLILFTVYSSAIASPAAPRIDDQPPMRLDRP